MDHVRLSLLGDAALPRVVTALAARRIPVAHLHVEGTEACVLVGGAPGRARAVLGRLVDVAAQPHDRCLHPVQRSVVRIDAVPAATTPHRWARFGPSAPGATAASGPAPRASC